MRGMGQRAPFRRPIVSAPRVIDGAGGEESLAVESWRTVALQPPGKRLRVAPQNVDNGRYGIGLHCRLASSVSGQVDTRPFRCLGLSQHGSVGNCRGFFCGRLTAALRQAASTADSNFPQTRRGRGVVTCDIQDDLAFPI